MIRLPILIRLGTLAAAALVASPILAQEAPQHSPAKTDKDSFQDTKVEQPKLDQVSPTEAAKAKADADAKAAAAKEPPLTKSWDEAYRAFNQAKLRYLDAKKRCDEAGKMAARAEMEAALVRLRWLTEAAEAVGDQPGFSVTGAKDVVKALESSFKWETSNACPPKTQTAEPKKPKGPKYKLKDGAQWSDGTPADKPKANGGTTGQAPVLDKTATQILAFHNMLRAEVGSPPLQWDPQSAATATATAQLFASGVPYGHTSRVGRETSHENLSMGRRGSGPIEMMQLWIRERANFKPGIFPDVSTTGDWSKVGHYSQMIWAGTTHIGCGTATGAKWEYMVCRYSPPGNQDGKAVLADIVQASSPAQFTLCGNPTVDAGLPAKPDANCDAGSGGPTICTSESSASDDCAGTTGLQVCESTNSACDWLNSSIEGEVCRYAEPVEPLIAAKDDCALPGDLQVCDDKSAECDAQKSPTLADLFKSENLLDDPFTDSKVEMPKLPTKEVYVPKPQTKGP